MSIQSAAQRAKEASRVLLSEPAELRNRALQAVRRALENNAEAVFAANTEDLKRSEGEGLALPLLKRLKFDAPKLRRTLEGIQALEAMPDPLGRVLEKRELDENLVLSRRACPIGVIGMIFESRPDALVQMASLCIKSGNAVLLKGGREAAESNRLLGRIIGEASVQAGLPAGWMHLAETREDVAQMLSLSSYIDLLIPRGSNGFVAHIMKNSSIPVLGHADGVCHLYIDTAADRDKALRIAVDAKMQYPAVCNAIETLLIHKEAAPKLLAPLQKALEAAGCRLRGCERTQSYISIEAAAEEDWGAEYLDAILALKVVDSLDEAIAHIHRYGSGHTEAIVTEDEAVAESFLNRVDAADVFHNCSTRFADGFVFGLGAEVGISTSKIHARGPVGVDGLLSFRWLLRGTGHVIADYSEGKKSFTHRNL
ncbi:MAG: glutamate-5-semialdehyde dehydrogenase [Spirochaeta sp. LUC14_002_19_P3]|nr:MAG: glutamate-5-semialdehyde dehydrogenase [Spirochaeta sp. LUC14_002_19_P3]